MGSLIRRQEFVQEIDRWIVDVRKTALDFFDAGVEPPRALHLAQQIAAALAVRRIKAKWERELRERGPKRGPIESS